MQNPIRSSQSIYVTTHQQLLIGLISMLFLLASPMVMAKPIELAEGSLVLEAPEAWAMVKPANRLIEQELSVAPAEGIEVAAARLTTMQAGGSVDANLARWIGQFRGNEGGADRSATKIDKIDVDGMKVTLIELGGTYMESMRGPFGPKTPRDNYRLVGAIVETGIVGNYFFKLIGPDEVVSVSAEEFRTMIKSLKINQAVTSSENQ